MNKQKAIEKLKDNCGLSASSDTEKGQAKSSFQIHRKNKGSFTVRKGNKIDWSSNKSLSIMFTKTPNYKKSTSSGNVLLDLAKGVLDVYSEVKRQEAEEENVKRYKIFWNQIEGIGK